MKLFWAYFLTAVAYSSTLFYHPAESLSPLSRKHIDNGLVTRWTGQIKRELKHVVVSSVDTDGDGFISWSEFESAALFDWTSKERAEVGHRMLGFPSIRDSFDHLDLNGDGLLSGEELVETLDYLTSADLSHSNSLSKKLDKCTLSDTLRCGDYISAAGRVSHSHGYNPTNVIQQCVISSPCNGICACIAAAERAFTSPRQQSFVIQDGSSLIPIGVNNTLDVYEKRFPFLILGAIAVLLAAVLGEVLGDLGEILGMEGARILDFKFWDIDSGNDKPLCAAYVYWSKNCDAIGTKKSRSCSESGSRLYKNSCKDHFRHGSKGCGFWSLGCKSLCYDVNQEGCPCWYFKYQVQDDVDYPGGDIRAFHASVTSECRQACEDIPECIMFVTYADTGKDKKDNCFLKETKGPYKSVKGATTHIKFGGDTTGGSCTKEITSKGDAGIYDRDLDWLDFLGGSTSISKRASGDLPDGAWPYRPNDITFLVIATFLRALYGQPWINQDAIASTYTHAVTPDGPSQLTPDVREPIQNPANPRWRFSETWRVLNVFRALVELAGRNNNNHANNSPVDAFLTQQGTDTLANALFPPNIRQLLRDNEEAIENGNGDWVGRTPVNGGEYTPYTGVRVAHAGGSGLGFYQRGAVGPLSIEAAFILATQVAGINFNTMLQRRGNRGGDMYWVGGITYPRPRQQGNQGSCMEQTNSRGVTRRFAFQFRPLNAANSQGQGRIGFYIALEIDQDRTNSPDRHVFVFAVHTVDIHSRVQIPNPANLQRLGYTTYVPPNGDNSTPLPGQPGAPPAGNGNANTRVLAHAHAATVRYSDLQNFLQQDLSAGIMFPGYSQIGFMHFYILTEDESDIWPRSDYLNQDRNGGAT